MISLHCFHSIVTAGIFYVHQTFLSASPTGDPNQMDTWQRANLTIISYNHHYQSN